MNEQLKFYKGNEENLQTINPQAGSIYHCEDTGNTYLANEDNVLEIYSNTFTFSAAEADAAVPVNADTLNGKTANDFATPIQVDDAINEAIENVAYISNLSSDSSLVLADAESLGGLPAENYATKNYVVDTINQAQLGGDNSEVDLSIYATKDDLTLVNNAIPTTPEDIGAEVSGAANNALNNAKIYVNEQINAIDYPVDSVNGKTGAVQLSASDVGAQAALGFNPVQQGGGTDMANNKVHIGWSNNGQLLAQVDTVPMGSIVTTGDNSRAVLPVSKGGTDATDAATARSNLGITPANIGALPIGGGTLTGVLNVGDNLCLWTSNEGGNIRVYPPSSNTYTDYWEMDSYNGGELRFYASRKSTNTNGSGLVFPLRMLTDGSISTGNNAKTRTNLGITPENINAAKYQRVWGDLTTAGWYRIATVSKNSSYRITLGNVYQNTHDITVVFDVITVHGSAGFGNYHANASDSTRTISQIRLVQKSATEFYVEFYYNVNAKNPVFASVISTGYETGCSMHGFTSVSSTTSGYVTATLNL